MNSDYKEQKKCGFCGESIPAVSGRCPYCGSILERNIYNHSAAAGQSPDAKNEHAPPENQGLSQVEQNARVETEEAVQQKDAVQRNDAGTGSAADPKIEPALQPPYANRPQYTPKAYERAGYTDYGGGYDSGKPLSNGMKVFLTVLFTVIPGLGQLAGIITAIIFMNDDADRDKKSFGVALLVASLIMFVLSCIGCFILVLAFSSSNQFRY